uniref:Peptidase S1 domain-containing protein n=1 Tax=Glossina palpalis gambiensis TaxID=67801 RepID=A0A1B0BDM5_9MUSC
MYRYFLVLVSLNAVFAVPLANIHEVGRIVNGTQTTIEARPYQVSLQRTVGGRHYCGGSIISEDIVVTAAHCVKGVEPSDLQVRLGSTYYDEGGILAGVKTFKCHEKFNFASIEYDIAIIKLDQSVKQSSMVRYIELAKETPKTGTPVVASGWGATCSMGCPFSRVLMEVELRFLERKECASKTYFYGDAIKETMVCAYAEYEDSCRGDSGGPLVGEGKLVGIVSWGEGCAQRGFPGVYTDVAGLGVWVLENAKVFANEAIIK